MSGDGYREGRFTSQDNIGIYYRDYGDPLSPATPLLCLTGLTRNSADYHDFARRLSGGRRVLTMDYRGRGRSDYDPNHMNYVPPTYVMDIVHLLAVTNCHRVIVIGTSLGGILAMVMGAVRPTALAGVVLNDIGPEIDPRGIARITGYVGTSVPITTFDGAAEQLKRMFGQAYPDLGADDWRAYAERTFVNGAHGHLRLDYDLNLSKALLAQAKAPTDLWPYFRALAHVPLLAIRGALTDILSEETFDRMADAHPGMIRVGVPNRGHVPLLDEPECVAAVDDFLERYGHGVH